MKQTLVFVIGVSADDPLIGCNTVSNCSNYEACRIINVTSD